MIKPGTIFTSDNLPILRGMDSESVDLIYLDPPFNSNRNYAAPIGSKAAGAEFKDVWTLDDTDDAWWGELADAHPVLYRVIDGAGAAGGKGNKAYCIYMAVRLLELHRVLRSAGSIYLHCDPTMSHSLKLVLDAIFGAKNFRNEIVWRRTKSAKSTRGRLGRSHDIILFYSRGSKLTWNDPRLPLDSNEIPKSYKRDAAGRYFRTIDVVALPAHGGQSPMYTYRGFTPKTRWLMTKDKLKKLDDDGLLVFSRTGRPYRKQYLDSHPGNPLSDLWNDISGGGQMSKTERTGYPTQKPLALLQRIIQASSNEGDIVLDPFCGCATACLAAESLRRRWIGIDISAKAFELINVRLKKELGGIFSEVIHRTDVPVRKGGKRSKDIKHILFGRQEGLCNGCRSAFEFRNFEQDHIVPRDAGGPDDDSNLQLLCGWCNRKKGKRSMEYLIAQLKREGIRGRGHPAT